jgi:hypothetical protein
MIKINPVVFGGVKRGRFYENLVPVGVSRGDNTNTDKLSNQLVQFFLRKFFGRNPQLLPPGPPRSSGFLLDGKVGPQTIEGINRFQQSMRKVGTVLINDSRVSVATDLFIGTTTTRWTIHALNTFAMVVMGDAAFNNLFKDEEINAEAPELSQELVRRELTAGP